MGARIAVGVVLLVAGAAKMWQPGWQVTAAAFGAPSWLARALPWVEVVLGAVLLAGVGLPWTAIAAAVLVAGFTGVVAVRVRRGEAVPCGCFGETSSEPVGLDTVLRNLLLVVLSLVAAAAGTHGGAGSVVVGVAAGLAIVAGSRARTGAGRRR